MKIAIISGVTGQDGSFLASLLLGKGYKVIGLVSPHHEAYLGRLDYLGILDKVILRTVELLNVEEIETLLEDNKPDEFYNLAAISSVSLSFQQPLPTFDFNTRSVINLLESIRRISSKTKFYQASSSEMFGNIGKSELPVRENFLFHPVSPYGISKASAHWLTINYREAYKLNACCGILFNHESALRPLNFVIKKVIRTAINIKNGKESILTLGNTNIWRDWGYAPLYVEAMWKMLQRDKLDDYLICSGVPLLLKDFVSNIFNHLGLDSASHLSRDMSLMRSLDLEIIYGDNTKASKELDWNYNLSTSELIQKLVEDEYQLMKWEAMSNLSS